MATTTTNYGWDIPQSTDLVKDGATAIATLGQDIDTTFVDLKGGTTGQILSKASNTDNDYTWIDNQTGDITGVTAGTGLSGGGTSGTVTVNLADTAVTAGSYTSANITVDAQGRITSATSGSAVADSIGFTAGKNKIINGDFGIWQRGTSYTSNNYGIYGGADRFKVSSLGGTSTVSQQTFTPGTAPVSGYEGAYYCRVATAASSMTYFDIGQAIEDVRTFAGQTITVSFWAKSSAATTVIVNARQDFGSGGSSAVNNLSSNFALTTSWVRYTKTISVPSVSGKTIGTSSNLGIYIQYDSGTINGLNLDFWGVQVEAGSTATSFATATGTKQNELAACQRYYYHWSAAEATNAFFTNGFAYSSTQSVGQINYPVTMRTQPTLSTSGTAAHFKVFSTAGNNTCNSVPVSDQITKFGMSIVWGTSSNTTLGQGLLLGANSTSAYLGFSAEL